LSDDKGHPKQPLEQRGIVQDVVVPIVSSGVAGATGAIVANAISKPKDPPKDK
jgi:hypothetical protein